MWADCVIQTHRFSNLVPSFFVFDSECSLTFCSLNLITYFARWNSKFCNLFYFMLPSFTHKTTKPAEIFLERKQLRERGPWRGRIVCVALNKVCMTHATRGLRQSKQPPLSSYLLQLSSFLSHFFTITSSFHPFMLTPPLSEAPSHVSLRQSSDGAMLWRGSSSLRLWHPGSQTQSLVWKWQAQLSESGSVSLLSVHGASGRGGERGQLWKRRWCWIGRIKIGDCRETQSRGVVEVISRETFNKCFVRGKEVIVTVSWVSSDRLKTWKP